jgi:GDPmannose 4,6-dehydratase
MRTAPITGVSGQDGSYLAKLLLENEYRVIGTSRDANRATFDNLQRLQIFDRIERHSMTITDRQSVLDILDRFAPDEVYNLAGQSSVGLSFDQPFATIESIELGTLNLLEAIRCLGRPIKFYNASSSECFGDTRRGSATEDTPFRPCSPYGVAKAASHWTVVNYREAYGLFAANAILFNHESPLRPQRFATKKIIAGACRIKKGQQQQLELGGLDIQRDWGWAPEFVQAMWRILQLEKAEDFVLGTGTTCSLRDFVEVTFQQLGLDWHDHVTTSATQSRRSDIFRSACDPTKARVRLDWEARYRMPDVVRMMLDAELAA